MKHRISMLWPDGLKKAVTFSYDDGVMQDLRLTALFRRYGLKATFNLNSGFFGQIDSSLQRGREIDHSHVPEEDVACVYAGFECAVHTAHHPWLTQLSAVNAAEEILSDRAAIEAVIKQPVRGMAYPFGAVNAQVKDVVRACGIVYARGTGVTGDTSLPEDAYDWSCSCHHSALESLIEPFLSDDRRLALLSVWGHSYEFDITETWDEFEEQLSRLGGKDDVWYATNLEIFHYIEAYGRLRWTAAGDVAENPTATDLFIECDGETVCIPAGERIEL